MEEFDKSLEELIQVIKNSKEYQKCLSCREQMKKNPEILELIEKVKDCQKKIIRGNANEEEYQAYQDELNSIPLYQVYLQNLEVVNQMIEYIKDEFNQYFTDLLN